MLKCNEKYIYSLLFLWGMIFADNYLYIHIFLQMMNKLKILQIKVISKL